MRRSEVGKEKQKVAWTERKKGEMLFSISRAETIWQGAARSEPGELESRSPEVPYTCKTAGLIC